MTDRYVTIGINAYDRSPLRGCVPDALNVAELLERAGYRGEVLLDRAATGGAIREALHRLCANARYGDRLVAWFSGHGLTVRDLNGDEPDGRDEAIAPVDVYSRGPILDDELKAIYATRRFGVRLTVGSDSCYSGTVADTRTLTVGAGRPRTISDVGVPLADRQTRTAAPKRLASPPLLITGCDAHEVSYDGVDAQGRPCGAMTDALLTAARDLGPTATWVQLHRRMRTTGPHPHLPSDRYPQTPQLEATLTQRRWRIAR